nr:pentatricopeptide repeat-containing protein At1g62260, mitochondrial [Tanacetum cinerariifolium]
MEMTVGFAHSSGDPILELESRLMGSVYFLTIRRLFDRIPYGNDCGRRVMFKRNVVSWNTMIMCYVKAKDVVSARVLHDEMSERDTCTWNTMISGYVEMCDMEEASNLFTEASNLFTDMPNPDVYTWNSMISGYAQIGKLDIACIYFRKMPQRNRVSWNSIISAHEKNMKYKMVIDLFLDMQFEGEKPDKHTLSSILSVCAEMTDTRLGVQLHQQVTKIVNPDVPLNNSLITMYAKCGAIIEARDIFEEMKFCKGVISWNAMIGGYASHGYATEALELFGLMKEERMKPTYITFVSLLNACANAGLPEKGRMHFKSMVTEYRMAVKPDKAVWGALLGACKVHNNIKLARVAAEALIRLDHESSTPYVLLHNMYADIRQRDDATEVKKLMEKHNIKKAAGSSLVDSSSSMIGVAILHEY